MASNNSFFAYIVDIFVVSILGWIFSALGYVAIGYGVMTGISALIVAFFNDWELDSVGDLIKSSLLWPMSVLFLIGMMLHRNK